MNMDLNLEQKQTQKLILTQTLKQSIQILRFNNEELREFLQEKSLENPLLKVNLISDFERASNRKSVNSSMSNKEATDINLIKDDRVSLIDFLIQQIHLNYHDTNLRKLMLYLAMSLDKNGYLDIPLEEAQKETGAVYQDVEEALYLLQQLDPPGVGARNLQECLMLQIKRDICSPPLMYEVVRDEYKLLIHRKWLHISEKYKIDLSDIQIIVDYLKNLSLHPGGEFEDHNNHYIVPDIMVHTIDNNLIITSNIASSSALTFRQKYFDKLSKIEDKEVHKYLKEKKEEFETLQKSVIQRGETIIRVATEIVNYQREFFIDLNNTIKPMSLKTIAQKLNIHESTVSRAVNGKYLQMDYGVFELKSFFSNGLEKNNESEEISSTTVKNRIKDIVEAENKNKPLSDQKIMNIVKNEGIIISRRTIAKYREELNIPSSKDRKRFD